MDRTNLTQSQINNCIMYWQPKLGLSDWTITFAVVTQADISGKYADVEWSLSRCTALIRLAGPETWPTEWGKDEDMETSIVHEMYHLSTAPLLTTLTDRLSLSAVEHKLYVERSAETISYLLVELRRQAGHKFEWERKKK